MTLPKAQTPKIEIFTKQEAADLLACLEREALQFQTLIQLTIFTGARRGELIALKFSDIDFQQQKITIERAAYKIKGQPLATKPPKDYETRTVTINESCCELLKLIKAEKISDAQKLGSQWVGGDWVFTQWNGEMMNPMTPTKQTNLTKSKAYHKNKPLSRIKKTALLSGFCCLTTTKKIFLSFAWKSEILFRPRSKCLRRYGGGLPRQHWISQRALEQSFYP